MNIKTPLQSVAANIDIALKTRMKHTIRFLKWCGTFLFYFAFSMSVSGADFNPNKTTSQNSLTIRYNNGSSYATRQYTKKSTDFQLAGTGLMGSVLDGGDHWILNITGGNLNGCISTQCGVEIRLNANAVVLSHTKNIVAAAIEGGGGVKIVGPGTLHVDNFTKYPSIKSNGEFLTSIVQGACVSINGLQEATGIYALGGIRVSASSLHVNSLETGIYSSGPVSISGSIVTVIAVGDAFKVDDRNPLDIACSCVHFGGGTAGYGSYGANGLYINGNISVSSSVFCASGGMCGVGGKKGIVPAYFTASFDNVIGVIAGGNNGILDAKDISISGGATKLSIIGNAEGAVDASDEYYTRGQAVVCRYTGQSVWDRTRFQLCGGRVDLYAPGNCALACGTNIVSAGKLNVRSDPKFGDFQTLYTVSGAVLAAEAVAGSLAFKSDILFTDHLLAQVLESSWTAGEVVLTADKAKAMTGICANEMIVSGGQVNIEASNVGIHLGGTSIYDNGSFLCMNGGIMSVVSDGAAILDRGNSWYVGYDYHKDNDSKIWMSGGRLSAKGGQNGILTCGGIWMEGGTLEAAATGGYSAGTTTEKPGIIGYALSANNGLYINGGSFLTTSGALRTTPCTYSDHDFAAVHPCDLAVPSVSSDGAVSIADVVPSWYGVDDLYPINGILRFWLPVGASSLKMGETVYKANDDGNVIKGNNVFKVSETTGKTISSISISGPSSLASESSESFACTATYSDGSTAAVSPAWSIVSGSSYGNINVIGIFTANATTVERLVTIMAAFDGKTITKTVAIVPSEQKAFIVTLNAQGGSGGTASITVTSGLAMPAITPPTRTGYSFGGYFTAANGRGTQYYTASGASARNWDKAAATALYAKWTANTYTVTLNAQGGTGGTTQVMATYESALPSVSVPKMTGFTFKGYYTSEGGVGTQYYTASGASARNWDITDSTTLFAYWETSILYVDATYGDDGNDGLSRATAKASIQAAIDAASSGDHIFVADGTYAPIQTIGKILNIESINGADKTVINGGFSRDQIDNWDGWNFFEGRCATLASEDDVHVFSALVEKFETITTLKGFTLRNGFQTGDGGGAFGGKLVDCVLKNNGCTRCGGGAYQSILVNCDVSDNVSYAYGGGAWGGIVFRCRISGNRAGHQNSTSDLGGGGGLAYGFAVNCTISGNSFVGRICGGGGCYETKLFDCIVDGNSASYGAAMRGGAAWRCDIRSNSGVYDIFSPELGSPTLFNCLVRNNIASNSSSESYPASKIYSSGGEIFNCTFYGNVAESIAGSGVEFKNCIVWGNSCSKKVFGTYANRICNSCIQDNSYSGDSDYSGNFTADPLFVNATTGDFRLSVNSPCIDSGNNLFAQTGANYTTFSVFRCCNESETLSAAFQYYDLLYGLVDFDGNPRVSGETVDIGAFEFGASEKTYVALNHQGGFPPDDYPFSATIKSGKRVDITPGWADSRMEGVYCVNAKIGEPMPVVSVPVRENYIFQGYWTEKNGGGTQYYTTTGTSARNWDKTAATTLYAKWTPNTYAVTLDRQSGTGGSSSATATYDAAMPAITAPTRTGYTFGGYYSEPDGDGTQYYNADGTSARTWDSTTATTLYAKWTANTYTITLNRQDGTGGSSSATATYDAAMPAITAPTRTGYTFGGYYSEPDGDGTQYYNADGTSARAWDSTTVTTLYAKWTANTYVIAFFANGGTGTMAAQTAIRDANVTLSANKFTRPGYSFAGWATSASGAVVAYKDKASEKNLAAAGKTVTLYAKWTPSTYTVKFSANGGKLPTGKKMAAQTFKYGTAAKLRKNVFTKKGYVFAGWATSKANAKKGVIAYANAQSVKNLRTDGGTTTLYAVWAKPKYKVAFYANGGKGKTVVQTLKYGKAAKLTANKFKRKGWKFAGWAKSTALAKKGKVNYKNKDGVKNLVKDGKTVKLYAVWKPSNLNVAVNASGASLKFKTGGNAKWSVDSESVNGSWSARSGKISDNQQTWIQTTVSGPGTLTFWVKVSCESYYGWVDYLGFFVDNESVLDDDIEGFWYAYTLPVAGSHGKWQKVTAKIYGSGKHTLKWAYIKDYPYDDGSDCAWIDEVVWKPAK